MHIVAGSRKHRKLLAPKGSQTRPTTERLRETVFNICQNSIEGAHVLDLFAGSGAIGLEALSRGAATALFLDQDKECIRCIKQNLQNLHLEKQSSVLQGDVFKTLNRLIKNGRHFDLIYIDPPYTLLEGENTYIKNILEIIDQSSLLSPKGLLFLEEPFSNKIKAPFTFSHLQLISTRRSGKTLLSHYIS
jgi:16S rRNA (guanine(966)-N(2))-methyltransferase RsmD